MLQASPVHIQARYSLIGEHAPRLVVRCPMQGTLVDFDTCLTCEHCESLHVDSTAEACVSCRFSPKEPSTSGPVPTEPTTSLSDIADRTPISKVMRSPVVCVSPDMEVEAFAAVLLERGISGAPVVDAAGRPIGVVSKTDLLRNAYGRSTAEGRGTEGEAPVRKATVADIMMPIALVLPQNERLSRAAALMALEGVHRVPVVRGDGSIAGIITALDIVRWLAKNAGFVVGD